MINSRAVTILALAFMTTASLAKEQRPGADPLKTDLDFLFQLPAAYSITPDSLEKRFEGKDSKLYFSWLTKDKTRAIFKRKVRSNVSVNFTLLKGQLPIDELIVDFQNKKFLGITVSIFNRGDGGSLTRDEFLRRRLLAGTHLSKQLACKPRSRTGNIRKGVMTSGYTWSSARGKAVLVYNPEADPKAKNSGAVEFMRLRLAQAKARGIYNSALSEKSRASVTKSDLKNNVENDKGNTFITGIPMVDQGSKGYCVVATAQRIFEYYGIACDMHQLAQLAKSDPTRGTSTLLLNEQLGRIDYFFKTRFSCLAIKHNNDFVKLKDDKYVGSIIPRRSFDKLIIKNIDKGIPLLWSMQLGLKPEIPNSSPQASGGHMRLIIGYNEKEKRVIFTDSWGAGHEFKSMAWDDFYYVTKGLYSMVPTVN